MSGVGGKRGQPCLVLATGVGGLSFLCQKGLGFELKPTWAVDVDEPAAIGFQINHPRTHVSVLRLLKMENVWRSDQVCS